MPDQAIAKDPAASGDAKRSAELVLRAPEPEDGADVHALIAACPPLDQNSVYANLLQCSHFSETCAVAERSDAIVGWVSGYIPPKQDDTYFLWQVAVHETARGESLGKRLLDEILSRAACANVRHVHTTITPDNAASWHLFRSIARWLNAPMQDAPHFDKTRHFRGAHDTEHLVRIGPFDLPLPPV